VIIPIALFAYKRVEHLTKALEGLQVNRIPLVYAFSDGAKNPEDQPFVNEVREIIRAIDWCEVQIFEREKNYGLGKSIRAGVTQVLEKHEQVIVVEDDIVLRPGAYDYAVSALRHYRNDPRVMSVTMWSHPSLVPFGARNGFFSKRFVCWGWGTYADQWKKFKGTPLEIYKECETRGVDVLKWGQDLKYQAETAEERNLWYVGFALTHFLENCVSYVPSETLTVNIGFDGSGENCGFVPVDTDLATKPVALPDRWPLVGVRHGEARRFAGYFTKKRPLIIRIKKRIINELQKSNFLRTLWHKLRN